ncbi:hypothetical protein AB0C76_13130 [Kitasatospora sp. NPDC048722]|uniref:hypothetical protein n=1 Tax=Kitasatospora sp. NPDC048722 TaxID=3155639 RepID=UPI0033E477FC
MSDTAPGPAAEPTHTWLITLQKPIGHGLSVVTMDGAYTVQPGDSRAIAYRKIRAWVDAKNPDMAGANVLFFSLEPNRL